MNRWKMHKLGFLNFWLYDQEEFLIKDGHILLRGSNASGKSITTQSFIPFLLDGNKSPERLDPFGSRDRKMEFYLLGDGEQEESTGYLYLEFKKANTEEYLTIGIGMRAQKGKGIDFWGFCLCDGRRIGAGGISLCEKIGGQMLPLSKQKLRNLIGDENNWAEAPGTYKQLVNDRVFQFRDIRQYDQLIQLLIKVRTPKLSKEAFRPSEVKKILNESLQVLTDEDLSAMVSTMERMDALEDTLRDFQAAMRDAAIIRNEYSRYNQYMLGMKGQAYLKAHTKTLQLQNLLQDAKMDLEKLEQEFRHQTQKQEDAEFRFRQAKAQYAALGEDDLEAQRKRMEDEEATCRQYAEQLTEGTHQLENLQSSISRCEVDLRQRKRQMSNAQDHVEYGIRDLNEQNECLSLGEEHDQYIQALRARDPNADHRSLLTALQRRKKQIRHVLTCFGELSQAKGVYDAACQALDLANTAEIQAKSVLRDAQQQEQQERDHLLEELSRRQGINQELRFSQEEMLSLKRMISQYRSPADWTAVSSLIDSCYRDRLSQLQDAKNRGELELKSLRQARDDVRRELARLREQSEPVPPRRDQIQATRLQLMMRGIPHAAFYEVVDFAPELGQDDQDLLEAQLSDAGLLDALVVPQEHLNEIQELLQTYPDRFLSPEAPVSDPITSLIPDGDKRFQETVLACLRGISQSDLETGTALLPDGRFRCGTIRGYSCAEEPAGFVGAAARRANRERQLRELEDRLEQAETLVQKKQAEVDALESRLAKLKEEREQLPAALDLDHALEMLEKAQKALTEAEAEKGRCLDRERTAKQDVARIEQQSRELSRGLPYMRTEEAYEEALDAAEAYQALLGTLAVSYSDLIHTADAVESTEDRIADLRDQASAQNRTNSQTQKQMEVSQARVRAIQEFLDRPENQARAQRRAELNQEIEKQQALMNDAGKRGAALEAEQSAKRDQFQQRNDLLCHAIMEEEDLEKYFLEDLQLGLSSVSDGTLEQRAEEACGKVRPEDRERTPERIGEALRNNYQQHNNTLLKYQPKIELVFDDAAKPGMLRQRLCISLQWEGKELSLYDFIQELQTKIDMTATLLEEKDRDLFENILAETISHKLRARIEESQQWAKNMTDLMGTLKTSMGLTFRLDWKAKKAEGESQLDTEQLVQLLNKDRALLTREDSQRVSMHFRAKVKRARQDAAIEGQMVSYADLIRDVLDYRNWYEFHLLYERDGESRKELTDRAFNKFSGGEKAMAMYVPLFAAVSAQYQKGGSQCPMLLALDEAFAGVDERNISAMFELVGVLDFDYIMNSQALWGCYSNVKSLDIAELHRPANASVVTILHYYWNGAQRTLEEGGQ